MGTSTGLSAEDRALMLGGIERVRQLSKRVAQGSNVIALCAAVILTIWAMRTDSSILWLIGVVGCFLGARVLNDIGQNVIVRPVQGIANTRITKLIRAGVAPFGDRIVADAYWTSGEPGALLVLRGGEMVLADVEGGYDFDPVPASQVLGAQVERKTTMHSTSKQSGSTGMAIPLGGGVFGAVSGGSRSHTTTSVEEQAFLDVRFEREPGASICCRTIWFDTDVSGAETMAAAINRLVARAEHVSSAGSSRQNHGLALGDGGGRLLDGPTS